MGEQINELERLEKDIQEIIQKGKAAESRLRNRGYSYEADTVATSIDTINFALKKVQTDLARERSKLQ